MASAPSRISRSSNSEWARPIKSAPRGLGDVLGSTGWNEFQANVYDGSHKFGLSKDPTELVDVVTDHMQEQTGGYDSDDETNAEKKPGCFTRNCPNLASRRRAIHQMLHTQSSTWPAVVYQAAHLGALIVGMAIFLISSDPVFWQRPDPGFETIEWIIIAIFTADYVVRLLVAPHPLKWAIQLASLLDLASISPFYIEKFTVASLGSFAALRGFRALRVFRLFRVARITSRLQNIVWSSIRKSIEGMLLLCFFLVISLFIFSTAMFYAEQSVAQFNPETRTWMRDGQPSPFQSIHGTFWWAVVTLTTVGYGDAVPSSGWGKLVAALTIVIGILLMAFPVTIFTSHFSAAYKEQKKAENRKKEFKKYRRVMRDSYMSSLTRQELQSAVVEQLQHMSEEMRKATDLMLHCQENWLVLEQLAAYLEAVPEQTAGGEIERVARTLSFTSLKRRRKSM